MSTIRIPSDIWSKTYAHLYSRPGEHFGFYLASWTLANSEPVFLVKDAMLVADRDVEISRSGWSLSNAALVTAINRAVREGHALIELHNHGGVLPRFSPTDRQGFRDFVPYVLDSLPKRPYGAMVWGDSTIYAEYFKPDGTCGKVESIVVYGDRLDQVVSHDDDQSQPDARHDRQLPWFTADGQRKLRRIRLGFVGVGGTGSIGAQNAIYLGARRFVVVEHDDSDDTSMNRLVTAMAADVDTPKGILARRMIKAVAPNASVRLIPRELQSAEALEALKDVDVILGHVDNDGARVVLNEIAVAYAIPYFDVAVGINAEQGKLSGAGARLAVVLPGGPCLYCMNQIDPDEARYWLATEGQREFMRRHGYVKGMDVLAPSVIGLNAAASAMLINELAIYLSGARPVNPLTELDLLGIGRSVRSQWMTPVKVARKPRCPVCEQTGQGDAANIELRYQRDTQR